MKREDQLLQAIGQLQDSHLTEAEEYRPGRGRRHRTMVALIAAVCTLLALSITALAANSSWREQIRGWFGVDADGAAGYTEYENKTVRTQTAEIQLESTLCSGDRLIAYFSVQPTGDGWDDKTPWYIQYQDNDFWDAVTSSSLNVITRTGDALLLQASLTVENLFSFDSVPICFYQSNDVPGDETVPDFSGVMQLPIVSSPILSAQSEQEISNPAANSAATVTEANLSAGCLELTVCKEAFEVWALRECVGDGGTAFCRGYYGDDWQSQGTRADGAYFTAEDELAIGQAYGETWLKTVEQLAPVVHLKDGSTRTLTGTPEVDKNCPDPDAYPADREIYRWSILPLLDLEQVDAITIGGQTWQLNPAESY